MMKRPEWLRGRGVERLRGPGWLRGREVERLRGLAAAVFLLLSTSQLLNPSTAHAQFSYSRILSLPVRNSPLSTDSIPASDAAGNAYRIPFAKFGSGAGGATIPNTSAILKGDGAGNGAAAIAGTDYLAPTGNGSGLTNLNGSNIASGTVPTARLPLATHVGSDTNLAGASALTIGSEYYDTLAANRTITFSGTPVAGGNPTTLRLNVTGGPRTLTFPSSNRVGAATNPTTSLALPTGRHVLEWTYSNGGYLLLDSLADVSGGGGATIPATTAVLKGDGAGNGAAATAGTDYLAPAAIGTTVQPVANESTTGNVNKTWPNGATVLRQTVALTANRNLTLPAANSYPPGSIIFYVDKVTSTTSSFGRAVSPAGSDTLNGGTSATTLFTGAGTVAFETDGGSAWVTVGDTAVVGSLQDPTDKTKQAIFDLSALASGETRVLRYVSGNTPTITAGTGAGTSPTIAITGSAKSGKITITFGTSPAASAQLVHIAATYPVAPSVIICPHTAATWNLQGGTNKGVVVANEATTGWDLVTGSVAPTGTAVEFTYLVEVR